MPKISVVMPAYNAERYIAEAIDSILSQTFSDFEFIIIDDGSTDSTADIIKSYTDSRIIYIKNEKNLGISDTLNRGIAAATGEYIARMDADDIALPKRFQKQTAFMDKHKDIAILGTAIEIFGEEIKSNIRTFSATHNKLFPDMLFSSCMAHPSVMMRRSLFSDEGFSYNSEFNGMEDYVLFWQIALKHQIATLPDCLLRYRIHNCQITNNYDNEHTEKLLKFKRMQFEDLSISANDKELKAFYYSSCIPKPDYCKCNFTDIVNIFKKLIKAYNSNAFLINILTSKLIVFAKAYLISYKTLKKYLNKDFSNKYLLKYRIKALLRTPYVKLLQMRKSIASYPERKKLKNKDFTIISNNCWAGFVYQKYGLSYTTPTIGLLIFGKDYVKFCSDLKHYVSQELQFIPFENSKYYETVKENGPYPVAKLDDIEIYFMHYSTKEEAEQKWSRRCNRINWNNIVYKVSQRENFTNNDIIDFLSLKHKNSLCFSAFENEGAVYIPDIDKFNGDETSLISKKINITEYLNQIRSNL